MWFHLPGWRSGALHSRSAKSLGGRKVEPRGWSWPGPAFSVGPALHVHSSGTNVEIWSFLLHGMTTRDLFPGCFLYVPSRRLTSDEKTEAERVNAAASKSVLE